MYEGVDAAVVRVSLWPHDVLIPSAPTAEDGLVGWRGWLTQVWAIPGFAAAVAHASPALARQVDGLLSGTEKPSRADRVGAAVLRYLLRASTRATPFGLFAGVAPARVARSGSVRIGNDHRVTARLSPLLERTVAKRIATDQALWPALLVQANNLVIERAGFFVVPHQASSPVGGPPGDVVVRATDPIRTILSAAVDPLLTTVLSAKVAAEYGADQDAVDRLLTGLVKHRLLLTEIEPVMTATDPLTALVTAAENASPEARVLHLRQVLSAKHALNQTGPGESQARRMCELVSAIAALDVSDTQANVGLDTAANVDLTIPQIIVDEAARAAAALTGLTPSAAPVGWSRWHTRFVERFGLGAIVPVLEATDPDVGLGYPTGYGELPDPAAGGRFGDRDSALVALAQEAALTGNREVVLDDARIAALADITNGDVGMPSSVELQVGVRASTMDAIEAGDFGLTVRGVFKSAGASTGRFIDLFDAATQRRMTAAYQALPTHSPGAIRAQITAPIPNTKTEAVARTPQLWPHLIPLGEPTARRSEVIALDDLAVTADGHRLWLVSVSRGQVVEPVIPNAVSASLLHPLARFLAELSTAFTPGCTRFDWGPIASTLPFLPALRHGRTTLSEARWLLDASSLPTPDRSDREWAAGLRSWMAARGCPEHVELGAADQRIELDLADASHRALLRARLGKPVPAHLTAAADPDSNGWIGGHAHDLVIPLASTASPGRAPRIAGTPVRVREHGHLPGATPERIYLKIYGHPDRHDQVLARLRRFLTQLGERRCWWLRYRDPEPHLRIRLTSRAMPTPEATAAVAEWTRALRAAGLTTRTVFDTDYPETGRFGGAEAYPAAEDVFVADSGFALVTLAAINVGTSSGLDLQAVTAASLVDLTIAAFDDPSEAMTWLTEHYTSQADPPARTVYKLACHLAANGIAASIDPRRAPAVNEWSRQRSEAVRTYLRITTTTDRGAVLGDLLHLHHARMIGPDRNSERRCGHLARAAALSILARHERRHP